MTAESGTEYQALAGGRIASPEIVAVIEKGPCIFRQLMQLYGINIQRVRFLFLVDSGDYYRSLDVEKRVHIILSFEEPSPRKLVMALYNLRPPEDNAL